MYDDMIERVAIAIASRRDAYRAGEKLAQGYYDDAITAVKAMMEPTENMLEAGMWIHPGGEIIGSGAAKEVWQTMLDAITND